MRRILDAMTNESINNGLYVLRCAQLHTAAMLRVYMQHLRPSTAEEMPDIADAELSEALEALDIKLGISQSFTLIHSISIVYPYSYFFLCIRGGSGGWCCKSGAVPAAPKQPTMVSVCLVLQNMKMDESTGESSRR